MKPFREKASRNSQLHPLRRSTAGTSELKREKRGCVWPKFIGKAFYCTGKSHQTFPFRSNAYTFEMCEYTFALSIAK